MASEPPVLRRKHFMALGTDIMDVLSMHDKLDWDFLILFSFYSGSTFGPVDERLQSSRLVGSLLSDTYNYLCTPYRNDTRLDRRPL